MGKLKKVELLPESSGARRSGSSGTAPVNNSDFIPVKRITNTTSSTTAPVYNPPQSPLENVAANLQRIKALAPAPTMQQKANRGLENLAATVLANRERQKQEAAAAQAASWDMRPSYMKQQGQSAVPQNKTPQESLVDVYRNGSLREGARNRAQTMQDYLDAIDTGKYSAPRFDRAVVQGRQLTGRAVDPISEEESLRRAMGGGNGAEIQNSMLSDEERRNYYYIAGAQGKKEAENYRQYVIEQNKINEQIAQQNADAIVRARGETSGIKDIPMDLALQWTLGAGQAIENMSYVPDAIQGNTPIRATGAGQHLSHDLAEAVDTSTTAGRVYQKAQKLFNNVGANSVSIAAGAAFGPVVGDALFAAQAAGDAYQEAINEGKTVEQAQFYGGMQAIDEIVTNALLGGIAERGGGYLLGKLKGTQVAKGFAKSLGGLFTNNPVGLHIAEGFLDALANGGSEAAQEYLQYYSERFEKWLATGEAPTYTVDGQQKTFDQLVQERGYNGAIAAVMGNPEALESALFGFLNAELMGSMRSAGATLGTIQTGAAMSPEAYQTAMGMVNSDSSQFRSEDTYDAGQRLLDLARDQQRLTDAGKADTLAARYGRGLMAQQADAYQQAVADTEMDGDYNDEEMRDRYLRNLLRQEFGPETAVARAQRVRETMRGENAQDPWAQFRGEENTGVRDVVLPAENRAEFADALLTDMDRISWDTEQGAVTLDREADGSYTFTNERGESVTMDAEQAADLIPAGQTITVDSGERATAPSTETTAPSTETTVGTTTPSTEATTQAVSGADKVMALAAERAQAATSQKEAQRQAIVNVGQNLNADNLAAAMNGATMLSEAEKQAALRQGMTEAATVMREENGNGGQETGADLSGRGRNGIPSQRTRKQTGRVSAATEAVRRIWRTGKAPADTEARDLRISRKEAAEKVIPGARKGSSVYIPANKTEAMKTGEANAKSFGLKVVSWAGGEAVSTNGTRFRGMTVPGTDTLYAQADNRDFTQDKILWHEIAENKLSEDEFRSILDEARKASPAVDIAVRIYQAFSRDESDEYGAAKELICDSNGLMNQFERLAKENPDRQDYQDNMEILQDAIEAIHPLVRSRVEGKRAQRETVSPSMANDATAKIAAENNSRMGEFSVGQMAEALGFEVRVNEDGVPYEIWDPQTGEVITKVTPQMVNRTAYGTMINAALVNGTIDGNSAKQQKEFIADLMNMFIENRGDVQDVWEIFGAELFSAIKNNSDKQYGTTIDFGTICAKTQAIVKVMSDTMVKKGRGLTRQEIIKVYNSTNKAGLSVPCPVCYVFSRWMGVPSLLETMRRCQETYGTMSEAEVQKYVRDLEGRYRDMSLDEDGKPKDPYGKNGINKEKTRLQNRIKSLEKQLLKARETYYGKRYTSDKQKEKAYQRLEDKVNKITRDSDRIQAQLNDLVAYNWVTQVLCQIDSKRTPIRNENGDVVLDPNYKPVENEILLDLTRTGEFADPKNGYSKSWTFRNTRGAGMGKAILPYGGESIGDIIRGNAIRWTREQNPMLSHDSKGTEKAIENAIIRMESQNLIGGQRLQSTSDFRAEWALDYLMAFMEMQAIGAKGQLYTKVIEAVDLLASSGCEVNMSIMGRGDGYYMDENGNLVLDFSDVTGISFEEAYKKTLKYDNAQMILVGLNDTHIKLALADKRIGFIIPWHSSGNSEATLKSLMEKVNETLGNGTDYTDAQSDKIIDNSDEKKALRQLRKDIIKGDLWENFDRKNPQNNKRKELTLEQRTMLRDNPFLQDLYRRFYMEKGSDEYGTFLNGDQAGQIFPYEYWDRTLTIKDAKQNGIRFQEYCASLGIKPRFSGVKVKGQIIGDFSKEDGYWKLLIDRRMYNRDGTYHEVKAIDVTGISIDSIPLSVNSNLYNDSNRTGAALADSLNAIDRTENDLEMAEPAFSSALVEPVTQGINSAKTSIRQVPALFKNKYVQFGETNIDIGGGRYDLATNFLAERGTRNMLFDPYNQSEEVNQATLDYLRSGEKADTATCANVLNVIAERGARDNVILEAAKAIDKNGTAYFMVYEGNGTGEGKETSSGWQNNRMTATYIPEIEKYFDDVTRRGKLIIAKNPHSNLPKAVWETTPGKGYQYSSALSADHGPTFYSKLQREIQNFKGEKIGASSVESYLKGKGVKDEEIKWSGIRTFLEGKRSVNKAELMQYLKDNELEIEETVNGGVQTWHDELTGARYNSKEDALAAIDNYVEWFNDGVENDDEKITRNDITVEITGNRITASNDYETILDARQGNEGTNWGEYKLDGGRNYREILYKIPGSTYSNSAMNVHWGEHGVLAHARVQDFDTADGKKALFVEEIQSDWHNAGQKNGYDNTDYEALENEALRKRNGIATEIYIKYGTGAGILSRAVKNGTALQYVSREELASLQEDIQRLDEAIKANEEATRQRETKGGAAPDAPFRTTYTDYVLKNLLRMAAEGDYDYLAWTTGKMQEERWSDEYAEGYRIEYDQQIPKFLKKYGKQWGAGLQDVKIYGGWDRAGNAPYVPAIVINDAMKESVLTEGQPMFSRSITAGMSRDEIDQKLADLLDKYGALEKGEKPARNVDVPAQTSAGKNTRRYVRTVLESGITTESMDDAIKEKIVKEALSYEPMTDKASAEYAASVLRIGGLERAQREWDKARRSDSFTKDDMALGQFLLKEYAANNDVDNVVNMLTELAAEGTRMGQNIQAMRMLKKYAQQVPAIGLGYIQRTVDQMNREAKRKMKDRYKEMKIDAALAEEYVKASTQDEIDAALAKIYKNLGEQVQKTIPEEIIDRLRTWRYMSMLGNPRTHVRNLAGNGLFAPAVYLKDVIGAGLERAAGTAERTKSITLKKEAVAFAKKDAIEMRDVLTGESDKSIRDLIMDQRKVFTLAPLNAASKGNSAALEAEDWIFLRAHYVNSLAQYITANNLSTTEENPEWLGKARKYAILEAQKATYRDANKVSTWLNQSKGAGTVVKYMMEGLLPFKKTPTNILRRGIEYSPAGLIGTLTKGVYDLNTDKITVNEFIDGISSGLTGTAIFGVGMFLASTGAIMGGYADDDDKKFRKLKGLQEYSVKIGNKTYTIDWAAPGSLPLFIGVETMYALKKERGMTMDDMGKAAMRLVDPMINMSMLSGLNDTLDAISYADDKLSAAAMETFYSLLGQYVPTLFGQVARTVDTTQRVNYQDVNTGMSKNMLYFIEKMQNKIPYLSFSNDPYLNEFGQENVTESRFVAAIQNFISPGYISDIKDDKVLNEIERLQGVQEEDVLPKKMPKYLGTKEDRVDLTSAEHTTFQRTAGQTAYNILDNMIDDKRYDNLTAEQQAEAIKMAYDYAKAVGRIAVQPEYAMTGDAKKIHEQVQNGMQAYDAILSWGAAKQIKAAQRGKRTKTGTPSAAV